MRDMKPAEMTSWLFHLLFFDGQGFHAGAVALWTFALRGREDHFRVGAGGRWEGGKELHVCSQEEVEACRALGLAHGSKKHLCETVGPRLRPHRRRQDCPWRALAAPAHRRANETVLLPTSQAAALPSIPTNHVNRRERVPVVRFN